MVALSAIAAQSGASFGRRWSDRTEANRRATASAPAAPADPLPVAPALDRRKPRGVWRRPVAAFVAQVLANRSLDPGFGAGAEALYRAGPESSSGARAGAIIVRNA